MHLSSILPNPANLLADASVLSDSLSVSAALLYPSSDIRWLFKIPHPSLPLAAELATIDVALKYVQEWLPASKVVILTDSHAALSRLTRKETDSPILCTITKSANNILSRGVWLAVQRVPWHVGIAGDEEGDFVASSCNHDDCDCLRIPCTMDNARQLIRRHLLKQSSVWGTHRSLPVFVAVAYYLVVPEHCYIN